MPWSWLRDAVMASRKVDLKVKVVRQLSWRCTFRSEIEWSLKVIESGAILWWNFKDNFTALSWRLLKIVWRPHNRFSEIFSLNSIWRHFQSHQQRHRSIHSREFKVSHLATQNLNFVQKPKSFDTHCFFMNTTLWFSG